MDTMRKCKECGKLFQPKGREQYCSDVHYRPCPVCGEPVIAKYLSDPPRRCANCKAKNKTITQHIKPLFDIKDIQSPDTIEPASKSNTKKTPSSQSSREKSVSNSAIQLNNEILSTKDVRKYIGRDYKHGKGFLPKHIYELEIHKDEYSYWLSAVYDFTAGKPVAITELFSSVISIDGHFEKVTSV